MGLDLTVASTVFAVIFVAELPDKTALATLVLASRWPPLPVLAGAGLALTVQSAIAIAAGGLVSLLPARPVHVAAGLLFLVSSALMLRRDDGASEGGGARAEPKGAFHAFTATFGVVFIAEWGDLTQLATAAFAARYGSRLSVFAGATLALWAVAAIAVLVGSRAGALMNPRVTKRVAAALFAIVGVALVTGLL